MLAPSRFHLASAIHSSGRQIVLAVTGGGSRAIGELVSIPGASRSILEARVPYAWPALVDWLGGSPDQACSEPTARAMAMAAWMRARELATDAPIDTLLGIGCTASLASDRPKRGKHRMFVAVQSSTTTTSWSLALPNKERSRDEEEDMAASLVLAAIARCAGVEAQLPERELVEESRIEAKSHWRDLLVGRRGVVWEEAEASSPPGAIFPGAFNPPHAGHARMADIAERRTGRSLAFELSIHNVDKPPLDFRTIAERLDLLKALAPSRPVTLTAAPTFVQKAELFPGATFVVGADTLARIADLRYYGDIATKRDAALAALAAQGVRFLAFGRVVDGRFQGLADLPLPPALKILCDEVPESEFRADLCSTDLRARATE